MLKVIRFLTRWFNRKPRKTRVVIDKWGGTSVNPSEVFRTERGRADLEAMASLANKLNLTKDK